MNSGIRKAELARRMDISRGNIEKLFSFKNSTRIEHLEATFAALGKKLCIAIEEGNKIAA